MLSEIISLLAIILAILISLDPVKLMLIKLEIKLNSALESTEKYKKLGK